MPVPTKQWSVESKFSTSSGEKRTSISCVLLAGTLPESGSTVKAAEFLPWSLHSKGAAMVDLFSTAKRKILVRNMTVGAKQISF